MSAFLLPLVGACVDKPDVLARLANGVGDRLSVLPGFHGLDDELIEFGVDPLLLLGLADETRKYGCGFSQEDPARHASHSSTEQGVVDLTARDVTAKIVVVQDPHSRLSYQAGPGVRGAPSSQKERT